MVTKRRVYKNYKTRKKGGQHYYVGRKRHYGSDIKKKPDYSTTIEYLERTMEIDKTDLGKISQDTMRRVNKFKKRSGIDLIEKNYGMALNIDIFDKSYDPIKIGEEYKDPIRDALIKEGFDPERTMVHGTSLENAQKIKDSMKLITGTFVHPGRGGFEDAKTWAENTADKPRVVVVEKPTKLRKGMLDLDWVTVGKRAKEREGIDTTVHGEVPISKIAILKPKGKGILEEDET